MMEDMKNLTGFDMPIEDRSLLIKESTVEFPLVVGYHIFTDMINKEPSKHWRFKFEIVIHEPGVVEGANVTVFLQSMIDEVKRIKTVFEPFL